MSITYDPAKNVTNIAKHGISFANVARFDFTTAVVAIDDRREYGETRYVAVGYLERRLHVVVFTETDTGVRVISLRKANAREVNAYANR